MIKPRTLRWADHEACIDGKRNAYKYFVIKPERKKLLGKPKRTWEDSIQMAFMEMGWSGMDWIYLPRDRDQWSLVVNTEMNLRVP
jgi:hypothetical protein